MSEVRDSVPRGFTRYYILYLLSKDKMTGKQIIDAAAADPSLRWKPSPGLIYPMLGRLLDEGYIEEADGKYTITDKGRAKLADYYKYQASFIDKVAALEELATRIASANLVVASEMLDGVASGINELRGKVGPGAAIKRAKERYREFLKAELERVNRELEREEAERAKAKGQPDAGKSEDENTNSAGQRGVQAKLASSWLWERLLLCYLPSLQWFQALWSFRLGTPLRRSQEQR